MAALLLLLEQGGVGHYANLLEKNAFTVDNISYITERDCDKMRITNRSDRKALLNMKEFAARSARPRTASTRRSQSTTRLPTASESCREATCFIDHVRIDKAWPQLGSLLAATVGISAKPPNLPKPVYGRQSSRCTCCDDLTTVGKTTEWEFETIKTITVGTLESTVRVWNKFSSRQNKKIDRAWRCRKPQVSIDGYPLDFSSARWHGHRVRRFDPAMVGQGAPFPTLSKRETLEFPEDMGQDRLENLQDRLAGLQKQLLEECHNAGVLQLLGEEAVDLMDIKAEIAADVADMFASQQRDMERDEQDRRRDIEREYFLEMDRLWSDAARSLDQASLMAKVREMLADADSIRGAQCVVMEHMECVARKVIEDEEDCERANLMKIAMKLNALAACRTPAAHAHISSAGDRSVACPICRKKDCPFFITKWKGHWARGHTASPTDTNVLTPAPPQEEKLMKKLFTRVREAEQNSSPRKVEKVNVASTTLLLASRPSVTA